MKKTLKKGPMLIVYRIFLALALLVMVLLVAGSLFAVIRGPGAGPLFRIAGKTAKQNAEQPGAGETNGAIGMFTGIGRLRIPLSRGPGVSGGTMILSLSFPYPAYDRVFTEELGACIGDFRTIAADYFSSLPADKLLNLDEDAAKAEILKRYNEVLRLGKITALYFHDLMIVD